MHCMPYLSVSGCLDIITPPFMLTGLEFIILEPIALHEVKTLIRLKYCCFLSLHSLEILLNRTTPFRNFFLGSQKKIPKRG